MSFWKLNFGHIELLGHVRSSYDSAIDTQTDGQMRDKRRHSHRDDDDKKNI